MPLLIGDARPYHLTDLANLYENTDAYTTTTDNSAAKAAIIAAIELTSLSIEDKATLKASVASALTANTSDVLYHTILSDIQADARADIQSNSYIYVCPDCQRQGRHATYNADGSATGEVEHCPTCDGLEFTLTQKIIDPNGRRFIDAP